MATEYAEHANRSLGPGPSDSISLPSVLICAVRYRTTPILKRRQFHPGVDLLCPSGTTIRAVAAGRVSHAGWYGAYGHTVVVEHAEGWSTLYAHCSRIVVAEGQAAQPGQRLAYVGQTGWATAPHLHFELRRDDKPVNPQDHAMPGL